MSSSPRPLAAITILLLACLPARSALFGIDFDDATARGVSSHDGSWPEARKTCEGACVSCWAENGAEQAEPPTNAFR